MNAVFVIAANTLRQTLRQRLFYNVVVFGVGMVLLSMVMGQLTFGYPDRVVRSIGLSGVAIATDLIALLVGVSLIHQEIQAKTLFVVLARPVRRWQYVLGRYLGLLGTLALTLLGLSAVYILTLLAVDGKPMVGDVVALVTVLPESAVLAGVGIVLSTFSTPTIAAGMGLGFWIVSTTTDDLVRLTTKAEGVTKLVVQAIYYALPSLARFNFRDFAIYREAIQASHVASSMLYGAVYAALLVAIASAILSRREMV